MVTVGGTRQANGGRPSNRYLLRGIARCERCQGKMHGTSTGRKLVPRYYCSTRRAEHTCTNRSPTPTS
jgi:hypothetical protein